jgi:hypothetical protein
MEPDALTAAQHEPRPHERWLLLLAAAALSGRLGLLVLPYRLDDAFIASARSALAPRSA